MNMTTMTLKVNGEERTVAFPTNHTLLEVLREEQVEQIHEASFTVLEDLGLEFLDDQALDILDSCARPPFC